MARERRQVRVVVARLIVRERKRRRVTFGAVARALLDLVGLAAKRDLARVALAVVARARLLRRIVLRGKRDLRRVALAVVACVCLRRVVLRRKRDLRRVALAGKARVGRRRVGLATVAANAERRLAAGRRVHLFLGLAGAGEGGGKQEQKKRGEGKNN